MDCPTSRSAEYPKRRWAPPFQLVIDAVEGLADDGVVGRVDDGGETDSLLLAFLRSLMSRIALETSIPLGVSSGPRLISIGNSRTVLATAVELEAGPHRAHLGAREVFFAVRG